MVKLIVISAVLLVVGYVVYGVVKWLHQDVI